MIKEMINLLVVEDDLIQSSLIAKMIYSNRLDYCITTVENGIEALEFLRSSTSPRQQVVLLDLMMPEMDGFEFLAELRNEPKLKPLMVYVFTSSDSEESKRKAYSHNVAGYFIKPRNPVAFGEKVRRIGLMWEVNEFIKPSLMLTNETL